MAWLTSQNIWRAVVSLFRSDSAIRAAFIGGIHEGAAPEKVAYPHCVWTAVVPEVHEDTWGSRGIVALMDLVAVSKNSVEASNLDQSLTDLFDEGALVVTGQRTLICHRVGGIRFDDRDQEGNKVWRVGGSYEIQTQQTPS